MSTKGSYPNPFQTRQSVDNSNGKGRVELGQIVKIQALRPFRRKFSKREIWETACKRIEAGKRRKRKLVSWWKSGILMIDQFRVPTSCKSLRETNPVRSYPLHLYMADLIDQHCRLQVSKVNLRNTGVTSKPENWEQVRALENDAELKKVELSLLFEEMDSKTCTPTIPSPMIDNLTNSIFEDPVITPEGVTYERHAIEEHLTQVSCTDPFTLAPLELSQLIPNTSIQDAVEEFVEDNEWAIEIDSSANRFFEYD